MSFIEKIKILKKISKAIFFRKKFPFIVGWNITYRCNLQCGYCGARDNVGEELSTEEVFDIIEVLSRLGARVLKFTGGEPLLRNDLGKIINFCRRKQINVLVNSNGTLVKDNFYKIKNANEIQLSLDGPLDVHDSIRGEGVYSKVIQAIEVCKENNIKVNLTTVISKYNSNHINYILDLANRYKLKVYFQPADKFLSSNSPRDIKNLFSPDVLIYRKIIDFLIKEKSKGNEFIGNSKAGLKYLRHWPEPRKMYCLLSFVYCHIEPCGKIFVCDVFSNYRKYLISVDGNFEKSFNKLALPHPCYHCWNYSMSEFNLIAKFNLGALVAVCQRAKEVL